MTVLQTILDQKRREVERSKRRLPPSVLRSLLDDPVDPPRGFGAALRMGEAPCVIAEVKRASPSKGVLRPGDPPGRWRPELLAEAYERGGAAALSVLTDVPFFWGHPDALPACREATALPVLRKDFILEPYQVDESRLLGADAILLIARALPEQPLHACAARAFELGMDVLVEVHEQAELERALGLTGPPDSVVIGVNNRDLATLTVDIERSVRLRALIPSDRLVVAESGLSEPEHLRRLVRSDVRAFLIGEHLARQDDPEAELRRLRCL